MPFRSMILAVAGAALLYITQNVVAADPAAPSAVPAARVVAGVGSAQSVLDSLEYLVVKLADKKKSWEDNIFPNLDIFLIGVSTDHPIRFDMVFDPVNGYLTQAIIPTENLKDFRMDNLDPIGIGTVQDKKDRNLFECVGTVYEGWMRYLPKPVPYSVFFKQLEAIPANMPHPENLHQPLAEKDYMAFLYMANPAEGIERRRAAFDTYRKTADESFKKLSTESRDQYEFRKAMRDETLAIFKQLLSEVAHGEFGARIDQEKGSFPTQLNLVALPETPLARDLKTIREHGSQFAAVAAPKDNILTGRINLPLNAERIPGVKKIYELARPVLKERIENSKKPTADEKAALNEIVSRFLDVLTENLDSQKTLNAMVDIYPANGKHAILMGISASGQEKINQIIEKIPAAQNGWTVKMNADKAGETAIHHLTFGKNPPKSLTDFYGSSNEAWIGVSARQVWMAGGEGALEALKAAIAKVEATSPGPGDGTLLIAEMNVRPIIQNVDAVMHDPELEILQQINIKGRRQERLKEGKEGDPGRKEDKKPGERATGNLANFVWIPTAVAAMEGQPDRLTLSAKLDEKGILTGVTDAQTGVLKALGTLIAKFADETLK